MTDDNPYALPVTPSLNRVVTAGLVSIVMAGVLVPWIIGAGMVLRTLAGAN